jgi:hypothetical protein
LWLRLPGCPEVAPGHGCSYTYRSRWAISVTITDVQTILTQPGSSRLVIVKVHTSEDELYGLDCATFTQWVFAVEAG